MADPRPLDAHRKAVVTAMRALHAAMPRARDVPDRGLTSVTAGPDGGGGAALHAPEAMAALRSLEALLPLVRDVGRGVWERLELASRPDGRTPLVGVVNALGAEEGVTSFGVGGGGAGGRVADWARCRMDSRDLGTAWDVARRGRRVVPYLFGSVVVIDPGVNRVMDLVAAMGGRTAHSCEGHPNGAYLCWDGGGEEVRGMFERSAWRHEHGRDQWRAYMRKVRDVHHRDRVWRDLCARFEAALGCGAGAPAAAAEARDGRG